MLSRYDCGSEEYSFKSISVDSEYAITRSFDHAQFSALLLPLVWRCSSICIKSGSD